MPTEFICDGCGKREKGRFMLFTWFLPRGWYYPEYDWQADYSIAKATCSRECAKKLAEMTGTTDTCWQMTSWEI
jgi:hypothetical protein